MQRENLLLKLRDLTAASAFVLQLLADAVKLLRRLFYARVLVGGNHEVFDGRAKSASVKTGAFQLLYASGALEHVQGKPEKQLTGVFARVNLLARFRIENLRTLTAGRCLCASLDSERTSVKLYRHGSRGNSRAPGKCPFLFGNDLARRLLWQSVKHKFDESKQGALARFVVALNNIQPVRKFDPAVTDRAEFLYVNASNYQFQSSPSSSAMPRMGVISRSSSAARPSLHASAATARSRSSPSVIFAFKVRKSSPMTVWSAS